MTRSTRCCPPRRSLPSRSRTCSRCSTRWASTSSRPRRPSAEEEASADEEEDDDESERRARRGPAQGRRPRPRSQGAGRAHRRSGAHVSARDGLGRAALARGRNRHRQAHRGRPRGDDRGPVRKPADLPGHHHLARRAQRGQGFPARHHRSRSDLCRPRRQGDAGAGDRPGRPADPRRRRSGRRRADAARSPQAAAPPTAPRSADAVQARRARPATTARSKPARRRPKATSTTTTWRIRCRSPRSRPSSSRRCVETFDTVADAYKRLRRLQDQDIAAQAARTSRCRPRRSASTRSSRTRSSPR